MVVAHAPFARGAVVAQRIMLLAFAACCGAMQLPFQAGMLMRMIYTSAQIPCNLTALQPDCTSSLAAQQSKHALLKRRTIPRR